VPRLAPRIDDVDRQSSLTCAGPARFLRRPGNNRPLFSAAPERPRVNGAPSPRPRASQPMRLAEALDLHRSPTIANGSTLLGFVVAFHHGPRRPAIFLGGWAADDARQTPSALSKSELGHPCGAASVSWNVVPTPTSPPRDAMYYAAMTGESVFSTAKAGNAKMGFQSTSRTRNESARGDRRRPRADGRRMTRPRPCATPKRHLSAARCAFNERAQRPN